MAIIRNIADYRGRTRKRAAIIYHSYLEKLQRLLVDFNENRRLLTGAIAEEAKVHRTMRTMLENIESRLRVGTALSIEEITAFEIQYHEIDEALIRARSTIDISCEEAMKILCDSRRAADVVEKARG